MNEPLWLQNLIAYSLQIAILALVGSALPYVLRLRTPRIMLACWQTLAAACLVLPVLQPWRMISAGGTVSGGGDMGIQISMGPVAHEAAGSHLATLILLVLIAGALARLAWLAIGSWRLRGYRRRARLIVTLPEAVRQIARAVPASATFYSSDEISVPATFGRIDPVILLPKSFFAMEEDCQRAIACHELLHVARSDWTWNMAEELILAILWFHPAMWWLASRIRLAREQVVDGEVVRLTRATKPYLHALLEIAQEATGLRATPAPLLLGEGQLAQRVSLMVKEIAMSKKRLVTSMIAASTALVFSGCLAVWAFPLRMAPAAHRSEGAEQVDGGVKDAVKGGVPGGVVGGVTGGVEEGVEGGIEESVEHPHRVDGRKLTVAHQVPPHYPPLAKLARVQGTVALNVSVDERGHVTNAEVVSGPDVLAKAALDAVKQWKYEPSPLLPATTTVEINFHLTEKEKKLESSGESQAGKVYAIGRDVKAPTPVTDPDPPYTPEAKKAKLSGTAVFSIIVDEHGNVTSVVEKSKPLGSGLDQSAQDTLRRWKFRPALREDKPVAVQTTVEITFRMF